MADVNEPALPARRGDWLDELSRLPAELPGSWRQLPDKLVVAVLLGGWLLLFHFLGNSTFGYTNTPSLFGWLRYVYSSATEGDMGMYIPFGVLFFLLLKHRELAAMPKAPWWPALLLVVTGLALHVVGFMVQQTRISLVGFFVGGYGLLGWVWGWRWLRSTFFPFILFAFCLPLGTQIDTATLSLRLLAARITAAICHGVLGINVVLDGTRIFDPSARYQYEVAAACSGLRSINVTLLMAIIYGFMSFKTVWRVLVIVPLAVPLAVAANVMRLTCIILAAEVFGQRAGNFVHQNFVLSLLPYIPAMAGILIIGHWLRERREPARVTMAETVGTATPQKS